ncbi:flotillin family protein [Pengzhenrongella phosphoraccumulans]|uniref:flotillin family protein n=1 Tax=Pengzhenrongella phosphoraccumulans TaxID=3114394 RepID=UPI00388E9DB6
MFSNLSPVALSIVGMSVVLVVLVAAIIKRYRVAKPSEAFVITGRSAKNVEDLSGQRVVTAGGVFTLPFVQQLTVIDLSSRRISLTVAGAPSIQGIKLNVTAVAVVKVASSAESIRAAAQRFGNQQDQIDPYTKDQLEGALRAIIGNMTVEDIIGDRQKFAQQVADAVTQTLASQGLALDTFQIAEVADTGTGTYIADMARPEAAAVRQRAMIAEAEARQISEQRRLAAENEIQNAQQIVDVRAAEIQAITDKAKSAANAAGPLEAAARQQDVLTAQEKVAERQAALTERQLDTTVRRPADAERYRLEKIAEANKTTAILAAEAASAEARLRGEGELARRTAEAQAVRLEGEASASAREAMGAADASALDASAQAYGKYSTAAILSLVMGTLPQVAHELAAPMSAIDTLTVISTDGASALPKAAVNNFAQLSALTGLDVPKIIQGLVAGNSGLAGLAGLPTGVNGAAHPETPSAPIAPAPVLN